MSEPTTQRIENAKSLVDFDQWAALAKSDPEAFEAKRAQAIEALIQRLPEHKQQRMRCLQWKIDQVRGRAGNPMSACIKISEMMWDSLVGPGGLQEALERVGNRDFSPRPKADVLNFDARP